MKQLLTFSKELDFKESIASITSISLEHEEKINEGEIIGNFILLGDYKNHNDTTEIKKFKYNLPYEMILPNKIKEDTIKIDITNFTYDYKETILKVNIDYELNAEENKQEEQKQISELEDNIEKKIEEIKEKKDETNQKEKIKEPTPVEDEYIIYHIHIVKDTDTIETITKEYNTTAEIIKEYNNIDNIKTGDKIIIPDKTND